VSNAIRAIDFDGYTMFIGPAVDGVLLEVGVNRGDDRFHCQKARPRFLK